MSKQGCHKSSSIVALQCEPVNPSEFRKGQMSAIEQPLDYSHSLWWAVGTQDVKTGYWPQKAEVHIKGPLHGSLLCCGKGACVTQWNYEPCCVGPPKMNVSWWRVLTKLDPLEEGMANHSSILALRTSWTVFKGKKIWHWKMSSPGWKVSNMLQGRADSNY